jgi:hypothetical protein
MVKKGKTITSTPEFESYARAFKWRWTQITATLLCFEEWAFENSIDLLILDGKKLVELSTREDFLNTVGTGDVEVYKKNNENKSNGTNKSNKNTINNGSNFDDINNDSVDNKDCNDNNDDMNKVGSINEYSGGNGCGVGNSTINGCSKINVLKSNSSIKSYTQPYFTHHFSSRLLTNSCFISKYILPCIVNVDDVSGLLKEMKKFRFLYTGNHKRENAAILIQSCIRRMLCRCKYNLISKRGVSATLIQRQYRAYKSRKKFAEKLEMLRKQRVKGRCVCVGVFV